MKKIEKVYSKFKELNNNVQKEIFVLNDYNISDFFQVILNKRQKKVYLHNLKINI